MKKRMSKISMIVMSAVLFSGVFLLNIHKNQNGSWSYLTTASAYGSEDGSGGGSEDDGGDDGSGGEAGGGTTCNLCVLKDDKGKVKFSCKTVQNETCKKTANLGTVSVTCNNAKQC